jgi:hypothetical protein
VRRSLVGARRAVAGHPVRAIAATDVLLLSTEALALSTFRRIGSEAREVSAR